MRLYADIENVPGRAYGLSGLGDICFLLGEHDRASAYLQESLSLYEAVGDLSGRAYASVGLGDVACAQGKHQEAFELYDASIAAFERLDEPWGLARALLSAGVEKVRLGRLDEAPDDLRRALRISRDIRATPLTLWALAGWAELLAVKGAPGEAARLAALVSSHVAVEAEVKRKTDALLEDLRISLYSQEFDAATQAGARVDVDEAAEALLAEQGPGPSATDQRDPRRSTADER